MATISPTYPDASGTPNVKRVVWTFTAGDTGVAVNASDFPDKTFSIIGTFNSATVVIEQSDDNVTFVSAVDPQGNAISKTANAIETILDNTKWIRPRVSSGAVTSVVITMNATK